MTNTQLDDNTALLTSVEVDAIEIEELNSALETFNLQQ